MNTQLVRRMNTVGKVGKIITIVVIVLAIIAAVFTTVGAVVVSVLPGDTVSADVAAQVDVKFSDEVFGSVNEEIVKGVNEDSGTVFDAYNARVSVKAHEVDDKAVIRVNADRIHLESGMVSPIIWIAVFNIVAFIVCAFFFKGLMGELAISASPFTEGVVKKMRHFAIALLSVSISTSLANAIIGAILTAGQGFSFSLRFGSIISAVIIFVLATVFRYGAQLQKESDETL